MQTAAATGPRPQARPGDLDVNGTLEPGAEPAIDPSAEDIAALPVVQDVAVVDTTLVTLGDVTQPGIWIKTPLVASQRSGTATNVATGQSAQVTLIPIDGPATAGSRASLQAMQALGLSLTDIAEVRVSPS